MSKKSSKEASFPQVSGNDSKPSGSSITVEPALLLHALSSILVYIVYQDLIAEKVCNVNLEYSEAVCNSILKEKSHVYHLEEVETQKLIGKLMMTRTILENIFPLFLVILIGAWSDKYGRKLPMLFVLVGFMIQNLALLICVFCKRSTGGWTVAVVTSFIPGLTGNNACFNMAAFSYVAANAKPEERTSRTGGAHSMFFLGIVLGLGIGGALASSGLGFTKIFILGLFLEATTFAYILFIVPDDSSDKSKPFITTFLEIFNTQHLHDAWMVVSKKRPGDTRGKLLILMVAHFCVLAPFMGETTVYFMFSRYKFGWDGAQTGIFMTYQNVIGFLGNVLAMGFLTQRLKLSDPLVGLCASISMVLSSLFYAMTESSHLMYFGPILGILAGANMVVPRSILSKIIPTGELGKVNSFLGCIDSISPLLAGPTYSLIYTQTFQFFPGSFFFLSSSLMIPPIAGYLYFLRSAEKAIKKE